MPARPHAAPHRRLRDCQCACAQLDDPLDAIAVHAWNGTWGVLACGFFSDNYLIQNSYGLEQDGVTVHPYGVFVGGNGRLLAAQIIYALWIAGASTSPTAALVPHACQPTLPGHSA